MEHCIICDLDGTLSLFDKDKKNPYNRDFENDESSEQVSFILKSYNWDKPEGVIFFLSGRNDKFRGSTEEFLNKHLVELPYILVMRKDGDFRKDVVVKEEMYNNYINGKYTVDFVIDDRLQVCRLWYRLGLFVLNVNQGLVEF
jgi:hypothetical protein